MRVCVNGEIIPNDLKWLYDYFEIESTCPKDIRSALERTPAGEPLELEINSPGGSVLAGFEIYSLLRAAKRNTVAEVQSLAASAASTMMCGCDTVRMSPVAQVMIHLPMDDRGGNAHDHEHSAQVLESITESILNGYVAKVGGKASRDELRQMMEEETWLSASRAVELGLADAILYADELGAIPDALRNSVGATIRNAAGGHDPAQLLALYEDVVRSGKRPEAEGHPVANLADSDPAGKEPDKHNEDSRWTDEARALLAVI